MTVHGGVARDDRTWPRWAGAFSVLAVLAAVVAAVWAVATASQGRAGLVVVTGGFVVALAGASLLFHQAFVAMLEGGRQPARSVLLQLALVLVGLAALSYDPRLGTALLAGLFGAMFAGNLWAMRTARGNRPAVDAEEAAAEQERARERQQAVHDQASEAPRPAVDVGGVLDAAWRDVGLRWLSWLVAGAVVTGAAMLLTDSGPAVFMVVFLTALVLLWVGRAAWSVGLARRDFRVARTAPERAWVVLLNDPTPRMIRPLLGVWTEEPVVRGSAFPRPDVVFRCDDDLDDLLSHQGDVAVHEAWVDTSGRGIRGARWVAADAGVALPHRRALFGRWFFSSLTRAERPGVPCPLRSARPDPAAPRDASSDPVSAGAGMVTRLLWRVGALATVAVALQLLA